jgi:hypothetical protein
MQLKKSVKDLLKKTNNEEYIKLINKFFLFFDNNYIKQLSMGNKKPLNFIGQNCMVLLQTNLYRVKLLTKGYLEGLNKGNPLLSILNLRALFETTGSLALLLKKYNQYLEGVISHDVLDETIGKLYLGGKIKGEHLTMPDPVNVMTLIDAVDHYLKQVGIRNSEFRNSYDDLSERAHPNSFGYFLGHHIDKNFTVHFTSDFEIFDLGEYDLWYFGIVADLYMEIYKEIRLKIEQNEELPFAELHYFKNRKTK